MSKPSTIPVAATVRAFYQSKPEKAASLSEAAWHTVAKGARGHIHPEAVTAFNKGRRADRRYVLGASSKVREDAVKAAAAKRDSLRKAGVEVGTRGPLPKVSLSKSKG